MRNSVSFRTRLDKVLRGIVVLFIGAMSTTGMAQYWVEHARMSMHGGVTDAILAPNGDRYFAGIFEITFTLGDFQLVSQGVAGTGVGFAGYVAKQGADGTWRWAHALYGNVGRPSIKALASGELLLAAYVMEGSCSYRGTDLSTGVVETKMLRLSPDDGSLIGMHGNQLISGISERLSGDRLLAMGSSLVLVDEEGRSELNEPVHTDSTGTVRFVGECVNGDLLVDLRYARGPCTFLGVTYGAAGTAGSPDGDHILLRMTREGTLVWSMAAVGGALSDTGLYGPWFIAARNPAGEIEVCFRTLEALQWAGVDLQGPVTVRFRLSEAGAYIAHQVLDMEGGRMNGLAPLKGGGLLVSGTLEQNTRLGSFGPVAGGPSPPPYLALLGADGQWQQAHFFTGLIGSIGPVRVSGDACLVAGTYISRLGLGGVQFPLPTVATGAMMGFGVLFGTSCMAPVLDSVTPASCAQPAGGAISMRVLGGTEPHTWSWSDGGTSPTRTGLATGMYTVKVEDASGCTVSAGAYVSGPAAGHDFSVQFLPQPFFRPGVETTAFVRVFTPGCLPEEVSVRVVLDPRVSLVGGLADGDTVDGDTLFLDLGPTSFHEHQTRQLVFATDASAQVGDRLCFQLTVLPIEGDADPTDNEVEHCLPVRNSYDPNDKAVTPAGTGPEGFIDAGVSKLTYLIRFQNTGNAPAFDVFIDDTLDTDLDLARLELIGSSHPMRLEVRKDRVLRFRFDDIDLPDSTHDEPNSHGYVSYRVPIRDGAGPGTVVRNTAHIFFDLNPAVVTNTTVSTIALPVAVHEHTDPGPGFMVAPNPARHTVEVIADHAAAGAVVRVLDMAGRVVRSAPLAGRRTVVDVEALTNGVYLMQLGTRSVRFVKVP